MPTIDYQFTLQGSRIPADHGYHLFSALCKIIPDLHQDEDIGIHPIPGVHEGDRSLLLSPRSALTIRLPSERVNQVLPLAGKSLEIDGSSVRVGVPRPRPLVPSPALYSRLVVIKGFMGPPGFLDAAQRQLDTLGIQGMLSLVEQPHIEAANRGSAHGSRSPVLRRTIRIRDKEIVGFALRVEQLTAEESILLQERGIGGRRRFGCGIFIPTRGQNL